VLAILGVPGVELIEADSRKAVFLREAARITAAPVTIRACRIAAVPPHEVDVVTARALAPLDRLLELARPFIGAGTVCLLPKGERAAQELTLAGKDWTMTAAMHQSVADPRGIVLLLHKVLREPHER
jgi:16S rRNA (guanine527-N7)-methyltransferase